MQKYNYLANMSANWNRVLKKTTRHDFPSDKQMRELIKKLFSDLDSIGGYLK